uniref:Type VI secretion system protein VasD n=1 Tax=Candidatus Kentrum sp. LFY TaxID=2126342 RepID=A0A450WZM2_9GAMM|nr:MAG: type VI secretion system protein VasD [Candidatus Kentron sp. LFY]
MPRNIGLFSLFALLALVLSGCCTVQEPDTRALLRANIMASEDSNPDSNGRPSPVMVRIYQLKSGCNFEDADFSSLHTDDEAVLGADLLFKEEMDVYPGTEIPFGRELQGNARYLGVTAAFRDLRDATWRALADLPGQGESSLIIEIGDSSVSIRRP